MTEVLEQTLRNRSLGCRALRGLQSIAHACLCLRSKLCSVAGDGVAAGQERERSSHGGAGADAVESQPELQGSQGPAKYSTCMPASAIKAVFGRR